MKTVNFKGLDSNDKLTDFFVNKLEVSREI